MNEKIATLLIQRAERPALRLGGGAYQTGRVYADFVVDGQALSIRARRRADLISRLGWGTRTCQEETVARLLLSAPPEFPWGGGRTALYVCPEDGDLQCGAVTAVIERDSTGIVWRDFGFETGLDTDPPKLDRKQLEDLGPFRFRWASYEQAIRGGYGLGGFDA